MNTDNLAEELYKIYYQGTVHTYENKKLNGMTLNARRRLARHVQKLILQARIDELKMVDLHETWKMPRLAELGSQLNALEGAPDAKDR